MEKLEYLKVLMEGMKILPHDYHIEKSIKRTCKSIEEDLEIKKEETSGVGQTNE